MNLNIKKSLSVLISLILVLNQASISTFASHIEEYKYENFQDKVVQEEYSNVFKGTNEKGGFYTAAGNPYVVYTQLTKSNADRSGNGTAEYPYNRFEDAVANVVDGGTIIIKSGRSGFINTQDEYGKIPFIIDKDVTIRSESPSTKAVLNVRAGGIVLEGNVIFQNIEFAFANKVHDGIFANGHTLEMIDCILGSGARQIDLFAGSLYNTSGKLIQGMKYTQTNQGILVVPQVGSTGKIIIKTTDKSTKSQFGKVFAGSMNGHFEGDANIEIVNNGQLELVGIYGCGGHEAEVGNMFDVTEPLPPEERPDDYTVKGVVNISMDQYMSDICGKGADEVNLALATKYPISYFKLKDINTLTIRTGRYIPEEITWKDTFGDVTLASSDAHLDLSEIKNDNNEHKFTVNNFNGGGILTLQKEGDLTIKGEIAGETVFQTVGGGVNNSFSGMVMPGHIYIINPSKTGTYDSFKFTPSQLQIGCTLDLDHDTGNWIASESDIILPNEITKLSFQKNEIILETHTENFCGYSNAFEVASDLEEDLLDWYYDLPYELSVTGYDVYYDADMREWRMPAANLSLYIIEDYDAMLPALTIAPSISGQPITPGIYEITLSLSDYGVSATYILNVISDPSTSDTHNLDISIKNNSSEGSGISFGNQITIVANLNKMLPEIESMALENEYDFYINSKLVYSGAENSYTLNVSKDWFTVGENVIKVVYGGSDSVRKLISSIVVHVNQAQMTISLSPDLKVIYDGRPHALSASIETPVDIEPVVYYYTDAACTQGKTTTPPVNVGIYYVKAILPENEYYTAQEAKGTITIGKATPQLALSGVPKDNNDLEVSICMLYPEAGKMPSGKVQLNLIDAGNEVKSTTVKLENGLLSHTFSNVANGVTTVRATYIPEINENGTIYSDPCYNEVGPISETFEMVNDYVPVQNIEFVAPALHFYVKNNGGHYQNLTNMQLPLVITPNNATHKAVTWVSSDPSIITINKEGQIEAHNPGQAMITAIAKGGNVMHTCEMTVLEMTEDIAPVESIVLDPLAMSLDLTTHLTDVIHATLYASQAHTEPTYTDITWKSMDESVIEVKTTGNLNEATVKAKGEGTARVVAITKDGGKIATCIVTVTQKPIGSNGNGDSNTPSGTISQFTDIGNHWAKDDIQFVVEKGLFKGVSETTFGVNASTTRGMFVTVLHRLAGTPQLGKVSFVDVKSGAYYTDAVLWAHALGVVSGVSQTHFMPNQNITREQLVVMLYKYARILNPNIENSKANLSQFNDVKEVSSWSKDAMEWAVGVGVLKGNPSNRLEPKANATRAEVCTMMRRFMNLSQK